MRLFLMNCYVTSAVSPVNTDTHSWNQGMISQTRKTPGCDRVKADSDTLTQPTKGVSDAGHESSFGVGMDLQIQGGHLQETQGQPQLYSLFPNRKGRGRKSPEKQCRSDLVSDWRSRRTNNQGNSPSFFDNVSRAQGRQSQSQSKDVSSEMKWPDLVSGPERIKVNAPGHELEKRNNMSFAEMLKQQPPKTVSSRPSSDIIKEISEDLKVAAKKKEKKNELKTRQTKPCLTKVVLNQISASTYGRIGKSEDVSKYVMSGQEEENEEEEKNIKRKPVHVHHELEVEFRELELKEDSEDDFEVEFSSSAPTSRTSKNIVNKISAMTFQQIGKTSEQSEKYVMKPTKSWSSVVGKGLRSSGRETLKSVVTKKIVEDSSDDEKPKGEMNPYDKIKAKMKEGKEELTPEEREIVRTKRRERRKREKENKKREKEEERRKAMLAPQTSKLHFISREAATQMNQGTMSARPTILGKGIKFQDEEYPDLELSAKPSRKVKVISKEIRDESGKLCSDRESNSEWETDEEQKVLVDDKSEDKIDASDIQIVSQTGPVSYSSILKTKKLSDDTKTKEILVPIAAKIKEESESRKALEPEKKKVKKKDPIEFDLFSAINVKRPQAKKSPAAVLGGKIKKDSSTQPVRNPLDSSAPSKKRGKEREGGKKKKKTLLKKIILEERLKKKLAREAAEKRRQNRIEAGVFLKPLPVLDEDTPTKTSNETSKNEENVKDEEKNKIAVPDKDICEDQVVNILENEKEKTVEEKAKASIHSRKFRSYCNQLLNPELDTLVTNLMADLIRFQDRQHAKDPVKAKARRRYIVGLREAAKFLKVKKVVCLVLAPDLEQVETKGGLDDAVTTLLDEAAKQDPPVPVVFGLNRRKLGRAMLRKVSVSCVGVMNPQGADAVYQAMLQLSASLSEQYKTRLSNEISLLTSPTRAVTSSPAPSTVSVLSEHAPAFIPSWEQYPQYVTQYDAQYLGYSQYQYCPDYTDYTTFIHPWHQPY